MSRQSGIRFVARTILQGIVLLAVLALVSSQAFAASASSNQSASGLKNFQHVFVIMMENTGYNALIGNPNAPWINQTAQTYGLSTNYYGVTHPSQPNYIAATSGSTNDVADDNPTTINVSNIVDQLESHGKTWKAYMQSLSLCVTKLDVACGNQLYERKHNPFVSYQDVQTNPARMANIVDFSQFSTDLANNNVPDYSWIIPDQCNDMHGRGAPSSDPCSYNNEQQLIQAGDTFLNQTVNMIRNSHAWTGNSVIFITWDESDYTGSGFEGFGDDRGCCDSPVGAGGGQVVTITISHSITLPVRPVSPTTTTRCLPPLRMAGDSAAWPTPAIPPTYHP